MNKTNLYKKTTWLAVCLTALLVAGCGDNAEFEANNRIAFKACVDSGGVPLQAWFNEKLLGDCVYKPTSN